MFGDRRLGEGVQGVGVDLAIVDERRAAARARLGVGVVARAGRRGDVDGHRRGRGGQHHAIARSVHRRPEVRPLKGGNELLAVGRADVDAVGGEHRRVEQRRIQEARLDWHGIAGGWLRRVEHRAIGQVHPGEDHLIGDARPRRRRVGAAPDHVDVIALAIDRRGHLLVPEKDGLARRRLPLERRLGQRRMRQQAGERHEMGALFGAERDRRRRRDRLGGRGEARDQRASRYQRPARGERPKDQPIHRRPPSNRLILHPRVGLSAPAAGNLAATFGSPITNSGRRVRGPASRDLDSSS